VSIIYIFFKSSVLKNTVCLVCNIVPHAIFIFYWPGSTLLLNFVASHSCTLQSNAAFTEAKIEADD